MNIAIICPKYTSPERHSFAFVHARAKLYIKKGLAVKVFVPSESEDIYTFESIDVQYNTIPDLIKTIQDFNPDVLAIHYPSKPVIQLAKQLKQPKIVWIHGHEILWNFRPRSTGSIITALLKRFFILPREIIKIIRIRHFLTQVENVVFVSKWMKEAAQKHALKKFKNSVIIPNPVDTTLFKYKPPENLKRAVSIRSFDNSKYGLEVGIKAFSGLSEGLLHLYGKGRFKTKFESLISATQSKTELFETVLQHNDIPDLYHQYGFFLAPSRVEAQGLAMCEAMSCGLPVIATNVGGIPEFVRDGKDGFLVPPENPEAMKKAIKKLLSDPKKHLEFSKNACETIMNTCSESVVVTKELEVLNNARSGRSNA